MKLDPENPDSKSYADLQFERRQLALKTAWKGGPTTRAEREEWLRLDHEIHERFMAGKTE